MLNKRDLASKYGPSPATDLPCFKLCESLFAFFFNLLSVCVSFSDQAITINSLNIERAYSNNISWLWKFELDIPSSFAEIFFEKLETLHLPSNFAVFDGCYFLCYCLQELKITQIIQFYKLFLLLNVISAYKVKSYANEQTLAKIRL